MAGVSLLPTEASIEEGEIVRESTLHHVIAGCKHLMEEVVNRLHSVPSHTSPGGGGGKGSPGGMEEGKDLELALCLQEGVDVWCDRMLEQLLESDRDHEWYVLRYTHQQLPRSAWLHAAVGRPDILKHIVPNVYSQKERL
jgi:hypothetical protein